MDDRVDSMNPKTQTSGSLRDPIVDVHGPSPSMKSRVLLVDDHEPWRRHVASAVRRNARCEVIGEVADGLQAVEAAERLAPDLIVLDIGLPSLSGIEVARRILSFAPATRILFLTAHASRDILDVALDTGAFGYVVKTDAGVDLRPAIEALLDGKRFISSRFICPVADSIRTETSPGTRRHEAAFFSNEALLLEGYVRVAGEALENGGGAIVITEASRQIAIPARLRALGVDVDVAIAEGRLVLVDVADMLALTIVNGWPDEARFRDATTSLIAATARAARNPHRRVAACGECSMTLWRSGLGTAAVQFEHLCDELTRTHSVDIWCGYSVMSPRDQTEHQIFHQICHEHSTVHSR